MYLYSLWYRYQAEGSGRKGSGRRGRGGASTRRGTANKAPSNDDHEVNNSSAASGNASAMAVSLKDQAAELLANQFLTVPSSGDGPSTSGQLPTQFVSRGCTSSIFFFSLSLSLSTLCVYASK